MSEKKISLIIPCYNVSEYLDRSWKSLKDQTIGLENLEIIFVNDMSTDDGKTLDKLKAIEKEAPESVILIDMEKKGGPGGCRNVGLMYASGEYLELFDADDELRTDACEKLYGLAKAENADIIQFNHLNISGDERWSGKSSREDVLYDIKNDVDRIPFLCTNIVTYGITNKFYSMDLIKRAGVSFPENLRYEEPLFVYPLFLYADRVRLLNDELYYYYRRPGSIVTSEVGKRLLDHPQVQLMLLEDIIKRQELFARVHNAIEIHFWWSFYCD